MKKIIMTMIAVLILLMFGVSSYANTYYDVPTSHWAYDAVDNITNRSMFLPSGSGLYYYPNDTVKRGEFVLNLAILMNEARNYSNNVNTGFYDVPSGSMYAGAVSWAVSHGITSGTSANYFSPNNPVTREQACLMIFKCYNYYFSTYNLSFPILRQYNNPFNDQSSISSWALSAVITLYKMECVDGDASHNFNPGNSVTRAEIAMIIYKLYIEFYFLNAPIIQQAKSNWCWSAAGETVAKYEYTNCNRDQWDIVYYTYSNYNNNTGNSIQCAEGIDYAMNLLPVRKHYAYSSYFTGSGLRAKILGLKPIVAFSENLSNPALMGHFVTVIGYKKTSNIFCYIDPMTNYSYSVSYSNLVFNPNNNMSWIAGVYS